METDFWHQRWQNNEIGFHEAQANSMLVRFFSQLELAKNSRVFLPLCGKTRDIAWLLSKGYRVVGAELSELAIEQLFKDLGAKPTITSVGKLKCYSAEGIDIFVGDFFEVTSKTAGEIDAIYDRAALMALPAEMRIQYAAHLIEITNTAPQLLVCFEYDQTVMQGPPFSISTKEVHQLYNDHYQSTFLTGKDVPGHLKGTYPAMENVWLLSPIV